MSLTPSPCNVWWAPITVRRREGGKEGGREGERRGRGRGKRRVGEGESEIGERERKRVGDRRRRR